MTKGLFITFEGIEGCGKSTQSKLLCDYLRAHGYGCVYTREPGGTKLGEKIRQILLHSKSIAISNLSEVFLFEAARAEIVKEVISPALQKGKIVICDRFYDATAAYQGFAGGIPLDIIKLLNKAATGGLKPDLTILLDIDTLAGLKKAKKNGIDRMEAKAIAYHRKVRAGYLALARKEPKRIKIVRVEKDLNKTREKVRKLVTETICHSRPLSFPRKRESMQGVNCSGNPENRLPLSRQ